MTAKEGYSSTLGVVKDTGKVYLDLFKFWPDDNSKHDGVYGQDEEAETVEHIYTRVKTEGGQYVVAVQDANGEYRFTGFTSNADSATQFLLTSKTQISSLSTNDQKDMFDYAARVNNVPAADDNGNAYTYSMEQVGDEDTTTTGIVMFTRPKQEIEIHNDTAEIIVEKRWINADGTTAAEHPNSINVDIYQWHHEHVWTVQTNDGWSVTTDPASEDIPGEETRICSSCGFTETRPIEYGGHNFVYDHMVAPTCTSDGYDLYVCTYDSSHTERRNIVSATGHDWDVQGAVVTVEPTCTKDGIREYTCETDDSHVLSEAIPATGHSWGNWNITIAPSETEPGVIEPGMMERTCTACGEKESQSITSASEVETANAEAQAQQTAAQTQYANLPGVNASANPVQFLPEDLETLHNPNNGNYVEIYRFRDELETKNLGSSTIVGSGNSAFWRKKYNLPKYDSLGNEYAYYVVESVPDTGYETTYTYYVPRINQTTGLPVTDQTGAIVYDETENTDMHDKGRVRIENKAVSDINIQKTDDRGNALANAIFQLQVNTGTAQNPIYQPVTEDSIKAYYKSIKYYGGTESTNGIDLQDVVIGAKPGQTVPTTRATFTTTGELMTLKNLPNGQYRLIEVDAPDGYVMTLKPIEFTVATGVITYPNSANNTGNAGKVGFTAAAGNQLTLLTVANEPGVELPSAGGPGTRFIYLAGALLTLAAGLLLMHRGKRIRT